MSDEELPEILDQTPAWGQVNDALNPDPPVEPTGQPLDSEEYKTFSQWGATNAEGDELGDLKGYANYVRSEHIRQDKYSDAVEAELQSAVYTQALSKNLINQEDGLEDNAKQLFGAPEYSPESQLKLLAKNSESYITAIAANNLDSLPEGTEPSEAYNAILTYEAKKKAYAKSVAQYPETAQNQEILDGLEYAKEQAYQYLDSGIFNNAAPQALLDGSIMAARIYDDEGKSYIKLGKAAEGKTVLEIIEASKDWGVIPQDAIQIKKQLETPAGFQYKRYDIARKQEINVSLIGVINTDKNASKKYNKLRNQFIAYDKALSEGDPTNIKRLDDLIKGQSISLFLTATSLDPSLNDLDIDQEEFRVIIGETLQDEINRSNGFTLQDDPDKMGANVKNYGFGAGQMHSSLITNPKKFEESLAANKDISEDQKEYMRSQREVQSAAMFPDRDMILRDGPDADEWLGALQVGRANGEQDHRILEKFLEDTDSYSEYTDRAMNVWESIHGGAAMLVTAPLAMADVGWARSHIIGIQAQNAARHERARLYGVEYGNVQAISETIAPLLTDMAVTAATAGAGGTLLMAKQVAKEGARMTAKGLVHGVARSLTMKQPFKEMGKKSGDDLLEALIDQKFLTTPSSATGRQGAMDAFAGFAEAASNKFVTMPAMAAPAFTRSAGSTYASAYQILGEDNPNMSHEEKHASALGAGLWSGFATVAIMGGFAAMGKTGLEDSFIRGMTKKESLQVVGRLTNLAKRVKLDSKDATKIWAAAVTKTQAQMIKGSGKFKGQKNWATEAFKGFTDEAFEEGLDEVANSYITDAYTGRDSGMGRWESAWNAFLIGGTLGSGVGAARRLGMKSTARVQAVQAQRNQEAEFKESLVSNLQEKNSPAMAALVDQIVTGPIRSRETAAAVEQVTVELDSNFSPTVLNPQPVAPERATDPTPAPVAEAAAEGTAPVTKAVAEGEVPDPTPDTQTAGPQLQQTAAAKAKAVAEAEAEQVKDPIIQNLKRDVVVVDASERSAPQEVMLPDSDAAPLDPAQFDRAEEIIGEFAPAQTDLLNSLVSADEAGTVRELRVATAIQEGNISREGTEIVGDIPEANNPERTDVGNRKNLALLFEAGKVPTQQWAPENADAETLRKSEADYSFDEDNYVVGVRDPETNTWVGTPPISTEADTLNEELESSEGSANDELDAYQAEQQELLDAPQKNAVNVAPILGSMPTETRNMVQEELGLVTPEVEGAFGIPQGQLTNANVDQLVPTTNSQVVAAQEDGLDLGDIIEQQEINFAKEDRILTEESDAPQSTTPQSTKPQVTKIYAGEYKVESGGETFVVRRRITEDTMMPRGWLLFSTGNTLETTDNNNWGTEARTLKEAVSFIEEKQVQALRKPNQSLQAAVRKDVVYTPEDTDAFVELVASGFPQRISSTTPAGFKVSNKKEKGFYKQVADNAAQKIYNTWPVIKDYKQPAGGSKFSGRKQSHYNPYNGETAEKTVKGFLDSSGNGVFNNDPVLANEFIEKGVPSFVDSATLEQINNKQFKLNPAIQVDYETGEVFNVISPSNLIAGQKQGSGAGAAQTVINTQPNRDTYVNVAQAADMFNRGLRETVMDINMIPLANGKSERAEVDRSEFTVGNYIDNVNQFISDGLSMLPDSDETSITLNRVFNQRGRLEPQYLEEAANAFRADAMLVANVFGVRQQIMSSNIGQNLLQETLDKKTGNPTGQYELLVDNATNRAKLMKEFIRFTKISNEPTSTQLDSLMQVIAPMTAKGKTPTDVATKFILDTVVNNPNFVDGQMPPMINLINKAADRYRKQQKSRSDAEATKAAEALYYEGKADQEQGGDAVTDAGSDIRWNKKVETADIGMPRPNAVGPDRATLYDTMDKAALNISSVLSDPANKDLREAFNDMALVAVGDSELGRKRVAEMDVESLANVVSEWAVAGNQRPRVRKFLKTLQEGKSPAATTLRKSFKLIGLSSRSVSGDPSQDVEYVEAVRESLEASMGTTYTARDARDYIRAIDGQVRNLWSRSRITKAQQKLARASNDAEIERLGLVSGNPESVINALQMITETGDPAHKLVAELLLENPALIRSVKFTIGEMDMAIAGRQSTMVDGSLEVFINLNGHNGRGLTNVLLEEYLHATLTRTLAMPTESMTPVQQQAVARLRSLMNDIREAAIAKGYQPNSAIMDSLANLDEFVAGILLSPDLQKEIKGLSPNGQSFFQRIAEAIMKFFRKGVTAKESSQYANAIADVIDLAKSTVAVSDPRMKVRAKRIAQRVTAEMKIAERRASDAGVLYTSIGEPRPEPAQLTPEEQAIDKAQQDLNNLGDNLTEADVGAEGNVYDAETEDAKRKARALLQVARELVPPEVPFRIDNTTNAAAEFRDGVVTINTAFIMDLTSKLGLTNSKLVVAKVISHELSHVAAFNIIPQAEIDAMAEAITPSMYDSIIDSYYADRPSEAAAAKALLRGTDLDAQGQADLLDMKARLTEEHLRMRMEKLTNGYTTEEDWAFYRTNPSLMKTLFRYVSAYFRRMAEMRRFNRELNNGSPNKVIDLALDNLILELRAIKAGYRIQETTAHFDPANPDGNFAILNEIADEGMLDPERFADSSPALQSAIALPQDFVAEVSDEYDDLRVGTSKLGTRATPMETSRESNVSGDVVSDALLAKQLEKMNYAHFPSSIKRKRNPQAKREAIIDWVVGNLIHLHDSFPSDLRARATHWYDGARLIAERYADTYGYKPEQVAGVIAALSPQKDWFMNVAQAEQLLDIYTNHNDRPLAGTKVETMMQNIIDGATAPAKQKKGKTPEQKQKLDQEAKAKRAKIFANLKGKTIKELSSNQTHQGWAVRILAQTIHGQSYKALSPEGEFGHVMLKESDGLPASHTWGSIGEIEKGIRILNGEPITDNLGIKHKVRSFFNNIIAPNSPYGDVTMDTHAIAAAHLLPFGASAIEVKHNLGSEMNSSELNGVDGVYHIYADAYRKAAAIISQRGGAVLQPRQLQSITWEAIRLVHPSTTRRNKNYIAEQKKLWKNDNHEQARDSITRGAKFTPAWSGFGSDTGAAEIPAGLQEGRGRNVTGRGVSVRGGGLQSAIGNPRLHGRRTNSGGTTLYRAAEKSSSPAQAQDRGLLELTAQDFSSIGQANKASHKFGTSVDVYEPNGYDGYELIMVEKNGATATASVSPTGEVGSVTKSPDATAEMVMEVFAAAVDTGKVKWLNGFDTVLPSIYADLGFEVVGRIPFDPQYKPEGWDFSTYKKFNNGQPDVVFMKYTGISNEYVKGSGKVLESYDAAEAATLAEAERPAKVAQQRRNPNGLQAAIAPSKAFSQDKLNYSGFIDQLELPFYSTGGYNAPSNKFKQTFLGMVDPRVKRIIERADFFNTAAEQIGESFKVNFDKQIKKAFGKNGPDADDAKTINDAIGRSAVLTKEQRDTIEDEYEQELQVIEEFDYETEADKQLDLKIAEDNKHSKIITLKTAAAKTIIDEQVKAIADLENISPDLARLITSLRTELIEPIQEHLKELYNLSDTMVAHFDVQQGIYLTTTYKMFTDSGYSQRMEQDPEYEILKEAADKMFVEQEMETRIAAMEQAAEENGEIFNEQEARIRVQADLDSADPDTLRTFGQQQTFEFLAKYERVGKNDIVTAEDAEVLEDNLKEKKDFAPELKALLGEVGTESGTIDNLVLTFMTVSKMAARQRMLQSLAAMGKSEGFMMSAKALKAAKAADPDTYKNWQPVISGDNISAYNPLRGMFAPADVVSGLTAEFESRLNTDDTRPEAQFLAVMTGSVRQAAGWAMATKTLGSLGFYIRNIASNMLFFGPAQGFYNMGSMMKNMAAYIGKEMVKPNRLDGYMSELTSLGIIKNEIRSTMLEEMLKGKVSFTDVLAEHSKVIKAADKLVGKKAAATYDLATRMAGAVDGFYKIAYYEHELKILRKAKAKSKEGESFFNKSDNDLKQMASNNVLMTAQSASQAPPIVKEFATHGAAALVAPFVRFKAEVPRIVYNTYKLSAQERKSDSSVIRNRGRLRFFGMTSVGVGVSGFAPAILAMASGTDDDDMEDFQRYTAPSYLRSHTFWSLRKGAIPEWLGGSKEYYQSIDLTYINPFAILMDPILRAIGAAADGDEVGVATQLIGGLFGDQYLDTQIMTQAVLSAIHNVDPTTGRPIVEDISDKGWDRVIKIASFVLAEAYGPDVVKRSLKAIELATSEDDYTDPDYTVKQILIGAVRPVKIHTIIPERQLTSFLYQSRDEYSNVRQRKNEMRTRRPMAGGRVIDILNDEQQARTAIDNMTVRMMRGAKKFGMSNQQIYETLRATNHPKRKAHLLMRGKQDRIAFTPDFGKNLLKNTTSKEERDMKLRRYREGIQWISEQPRIRTLSEEPIYKPE